MMLGSLAAGLLFTMVFAATALGCALRRANWASAGFCIAMCAALTAMAWWAEPADAVWLQVAVFGGAALWLLLAGGVRAGLHHVLMAAAMTWMLTAVPAHDPMPGMATAAPSLLVLTISALVAACCVAASIPLVTRADRGAAGQAAMSVGMAAMLIAML
jgi:hypothetical protein